MCRYGEIGDINECLKLMEMVKEDLAYYKEKEFLETLKKGIENKEIILNIDNRIVTGLLQFSLQNKELTLLVVHPAYRGKKLAKRLIEIMLMNFSKGDEVHVITFRDGEAKGISAIKCYRSCGFEHVEDLIEFGYPSQKMICKVK